MNAKNVIEQIQETYAEWIEHAENPLQFIAGVLANKIVMQQHHIDYLERRIANEDSFANR